MKRVIFISSFDYPSRYAHAIHGLHMARAFHQQLGDNFLFMVNTVVDDTLSQIPHHLLFGRFGRRAKKLHLRRLLLPFALRHFFHQNTSWQGSSTIVFVNDPHLIAFAVSLKKKFGIRFIFESHGLLSETQLSELDEHALRVIFVTHFLQHEAISNNTLQVVKTLMLPNAVDTKAFARITDDRTALRSELSLPEGFLVGYVGRFVPMGEDKGLKLMITALTELPPIVRLVLVGGTKKEIENYTQYAQSLGLQDRVTLIPHVPPDTVPRYEKACDILAYIPAGGSDYFEKETSPMKIFEYMASGRPAVLSDLPTVRSIVPTDAVYLVSRGSIAAYIDAIKQIMANPADADRRAAEARRLSESNTWEARVARILQSFD